MQLKLDIHLESVQRTLLLPTVSFHDHKEGEGIDVSALDGKEAKLPFKILLPTNLGTDDFRYEYKEYIRPGASNLPKLNGAIITFENYRNHILIGFESMMKFFLKKKDLLLEEGLPFNKFKNCTIRSVLKDTQKYVDLLNYANHPNYAENMLKKEKLIENIWVYPHQNKEIIKYEYSDMMFDDIPVFYSLSNEKYLVSSGGNKVHDFFEYSGYEKVIDRINKLNEKEIEKQSSIIKASLGLYAEQILQLKGMRQYYSDLDYNYDLLSEVKKISKFILERSISSRDGSELAFFDVISSTMNAGAWEINHINHDFYDGLSGVAFFFFELYSVTLENEYFQTYKKIMKASITETAFEPELNSFGGKASIIFPILNEIYKMGDSEFKPFCIEVLELIKKQEKELTAKDWLSGIEGMIPLLVDASTLLEDKSYFDLANRFVDRIVRTDLPKAIGLGHGLSGIALSVFKVYEKTKRAKYRKFIEKALDLEDDLIQNGNNVEDSWCWGLTGVALARIEMNSLLKRNNSLLFEKFMNRIYSMMKKDDSICHGNAGELELLLQYQTLDSEASKVINEKISDILKHQQLDGRYAVGYLPQFLSLSLFTGVSGIGYQFLRILYPSTLTKL